MPNVMMTRKAHENAISNSKNISGASKVDETPQSTTHNDASGGASVQTT